MENVEKLPVSSLEIPMLEILSPLRSAALDAVEDLMTEAFMQVGALLARISRESGKQLTFNRQAGGLAPFLLKQIHDHATTGTLERWMTEDAGKDRYRKISDFLDLYRMQQNDFKARFPKAYQKWSPEEDAELLRLYQLASEGGRKVQWKELTSPLERNENAIKIRLGRLGIDLGEEAGVPRRR